MPITAYDRSFYEMQQDDSSLSAKRIVPIIMQILKPKSVIDVGCGVGTWSAEFLSNGATRVLGVDGDYVDRKMLHIPEEMFRAVDLSEMFDFGRFDLALSVEVAEHLPESSARAFVESLTKSSRFVVFSAAHPGQGGVEHINEQWASYWASIFEEFGFSAIDVIRPAIWSDTSIQLCYRHNILLFIRSSEVPAHLTTVSDIRALDKVHPERWDRIRKNRNRESKRTDCNRGAKRGIRGIIGRILSI